MPLVPQETQRAPRSSTPDAGTTTARPPRAVDTSSFDAGQRAKSPDAQPGYDAQVAARAPVPDVVGGLVAVARGSITRYADDGAKAATHAAEWVEALDRHLDVFASGDLGVMAAEKALKVAVDAVDRQERMANVLDMLSSLLSIGSAVTKVIDIAKALASQPAAVESLVSLGGRLSAAGDIVGGVKAAREVGPRGASVVSEALAKVTSLAGSMNEKLDGVAFMGLESDARNAGQRLEDAALHVKHAREAVDELHVVMPGAIGPAELVALLAPIGRRVVAAKQRLEQLKARVEAIAASRAGTMAPGGLPRTLYDAFAADADLASRVALVSDTMLLVDVGADATVKKEEHVARSWRVRCADAEAETRLASLGLAADEDLGELGAKALGKVVSSREQVNDVVLRERDLGEERKIGIERWRADAPGEMRAFRRHVDEVKRRTLPHGERLRL
ncbi:MAG: hypothetical protein KC635_22785 [Myxococcales bacterium]|nr:hypothetical protein [Myxococcales bacterium]